jgi:hypothetical protein
VHGGDGARGRFGLHGDEDDRDGLSAAGDGLGAGGEGGRVGGEERSDGRACDESEARGSLPGG